MKTTFSALTLLVLATTGVTGPTLATPVVTDSVIYSIMPRDHAEIKGTVVRLADIFTGIDGGKDAAIALAPAPCKQMTYDLPVLKRLAQKYNLAWEPKTQQESTTVHAGCTRITSEAVASAVIAKMKEDGVLGEIAVLFDNPNVELTLPPEQSAQFTLNNFVADTLSRRFHANLVAENGTTVQLSGRAVVKRAVPVLAHRLQAGDVISAADIDWMMVSEDQASLAVLTEEKQLLGKEVRRDTEAQALLHAGDVMLPRLVTRGSIVTIKIETSTMALAVQGKALQDGAEGDLVRVQNTQSNRILEGKVEGSGVVRINIAQKLAMAQ